MLQKPYPNDPKKLEAEVSAVVKIKDIEELYSLRERISVKWWETGLILVLFASGFGFILTASKLIPISHPLIYWFSLFWVAAIIIILIACIEFLIAKFRALRRLYEIHARILLEIQRELNEIKKRLPPAPPLSSEEKKE